MKLVAAGRWGQYACKHVCLKHVFTVEMYDYEPRFYSLNPKYLTFAAV